MYQPGHFILCCGSRPVRSSLLFRKFFLRTCFLKQQSVVDDFSDVVMTRKDNSTRKLSGEFTIWCDLRQFWHDLKVNVRMLRPTTMHPFTTTSIVFRARLIPWIQLYPVTKKGFHSSNATEADSLALSDRFYSQNNIEPESPPGD